jgi:hypothetical protein
VWAGGSLEQGSLLYWDGQWWSEISWYRKGGLLTGLSGFKKDSVFASDSDFVLSWSGTEWEKMPSAPSESPNPRMAFIGLIDGMIATSPTTLLAWWGNPLGVLGINAMLEFYEPNQGWKSVSCPVEGLKVIRFVASENPDSIWAATDSFGEIYHITNRESCVLDGRITGMTIDTLYFNNGVLWVGGREGRLAFKKVVQ